MLPIFVFLVSLLLLSVYLYATQNSDDGDPFTVLFLVSILIFGPFIPLLIDQENPTIVKLKNICVPLKHYTSQHRAYRGGLQYCKFSSARLKDKIVTVIGHLPLNQKVEVYHITHKFKYQKDRTYYISCDDYDRLHRSKDY